MPGWKLTYRRGLRFRSISRRFDNASDTTPSGLVNTSTILVRALVTSFQNPGSGDGTLIGHFVGCFFIISPHLVASSIIWLLRSSEIQLRLFVGRKKGRPSQGLSEAGRSAVAYTLQSNCRGRFNDFDLDLVCRCRRMCHAEQHRSQKRRNGSHPRLRRQSYA